MSYPGPQSVDFDDVRALNRTFLKRLQEDPTLAGRAVQLREDLTRRLADLSPQQADRLAEAPFLLMSFRENDDRFWDDLYAADPHRDLYEEPAAPDDTSRLIAAGLGFAWQLARQNPYALRLVGGASLHWCERLGQRPLIQVLDGDSGGRCGHPHNARRQRRQSLGETAVCRRQSRRTDSRCRATNGPAGITHGTGGRSTDSLRIGGVSPPDTRVLYRR